MQAILTKYLGPTDTKAGRIKASCQRGSITVEWDHALNPEENHVNAASALCLRFIDEDVAKYRGNANGNPWGRQRFSGQLPDGSWVHVFADVSVL